MALNDLDVTEISLIETSLASLQVIAQTAEDNIANIQAVLQDRANGILEEPELNLDGISHLASDDPTIQAIVDNYAKFVQDNIIAPFEENKARFEQLSGETQLNLQGEEPPIFDLTYGPPISVKGQFILSEDGLYYDSISGGIPEVSGMVAASSTWNLKYAPNLGGKGNLYTQDDLKNFTDTVFDYDYTPDDSTAGLYYDSDDILQTFEKNKILHTTLVHDQINDLVASGYSTSSAVVVNYYGNIGAIAALYDEKTRKRKKQLQLVSIFASDKYSFSEDSGSSDPLNANFNPKNLGLGSGVLIEDKSDTLIPDWHPIERIPLNDFSFMRGTGVEVSLVQQEKLLLFSEDLEDIILPITPVFVQSNAQPFSVIDKFTLSPTNPESFPFFRGTNNVSGNSGLVQSLVESVVSDGMVLGYNFIKPNIVDASSSKFNLDNISPDSGGFLNGQLVASSLDSVFPSGLGIPKLTGTGPNQSYVRLPTSYTPDGVEQRLKTEQLDSLFYGSNKKYNKTTKVGGGVTFDFWVHIPSLVMTDTHRYRVVAACENSGGYSYLPSTSIRANRTNISGIHDDRKVHGMILGFRDRGGVTTPSGLEFGVFPTVSQNDNHGTYGHSVAIAESHEYIDSVFQLSGITELGTTVASSTSVNGKSIIDASAGFVHMATVFNFEEDSVKIFCDGELLTTSSIATSFDLAYTNTLNIPSPTKGGDTYLVSSWHNTSNNGPVIGKFGGMDSFTPWILGGGFTDGIEKATSVDPDDEPGFLGYNTNSTYGEPPASQHLPAWATSHTVKPSSGLDGFLGSFKLYSRALSNSEVKKNFTFQKGFYKNILT